MVLSTLLCILQHLSMMVVQLVPEWGVAAPTPTPRSSSRQKCSGSGDTYNRWGYEFEPQLLLELKEVLSTRHGRVLVCDIELYTIESPPESTPIP